MHCGVSRGFLRIAVVVAVGIASLVGVSRTSAESDGLPPSMPYAATESEVSGADSATPPPETLTITKTWKDDVEEYDPWQPFNEGTFSFNRQFDRVLLKPVATVWDTILPDPVQRSLNNAFDNLGMPRRLLNNLFQFKLVGVGRELARFLLNTTVGIAGFFDVAKTLGIEKSDEDAGQTLGVYGIGPGPYLVLPFLPPLTVRDGLGAVIDLATDPLNYVFPFAALVGTKGGSIVNDRSLNLEFYQSVEENVLDLYSAVRNAYLQRRVKQISE